METQGTDDPSFRSNRVAKGRRGRTEHAAMGNNESKGSESSLSDMSFDKKNYKEHIRMLKERE